MKGQLGIQGIHGMPGMEGPPGEIGTDGPPGQVGERGVFGEEGPGGDKGYRVSNNIAWILMENKRKVYYTRSVDTCFHYLQGDPGLPGSRGAPGSQVRVAGEMTFPAAKPDHTHWPCFMTTVFLVAL